MGVSFSLFKSLDFFASSLLHMGGIKPISGRYSIDAHDIAWLLYPFLLRLRLNWTTKQSY